MKVYIASGLENAPRVQQLRNALAEVGISLSYDWTTHGSVQDQGPARIAQVAALEQRGVLEADAVVILLPGGRGTHTELGIALGSGKPVLVFGPRQGADGNECCFYYSPNVLVRHDTVDDEIISTTLRALRRFVSNEQQVAGSFMSSVPAPNYGHTRFP